MRNRDRESGHNPESLQSLTEYQLLQEYQRLQVLAHHEAGHRDQMQTGTIMGAEGEIRLDPKDAKKWAEGHQDNTEKTFAELHEVQKEIDERVKRGEMKRPPTMEEQKM